MKADAREGLIPTAAVRALIADCMLECGVPATDADKIAELMLEADLIGADAHGVFRLPQYVQRLSRPIRARTSKSNAPRRRLRLCRATMAWAISSSRVRRKPRSSSRARRASPGSAA
jgi:hypothetical protein